MIRALVLSLALLLIGAPLAKITPTASAANPTFQIISSNPNFTALAADATGAIYGKSTSNNSQLYKSTDEGATWNLAFSLPDATNYRIWYLTPLASGTLLMQTSSLGKWTVYRSTNGGTSWTQVLQLPDTPVFYTGLGPRSITDGNGFVWLGTYNTGPSAGAPYSNYIYRSSNDGQTWSLTNTTTTHRHIHGVGYNPANHKLYVYFGDSGGPDGMWQSSDNGVTLQALCTDYNCITINNAFDPTGSYSIYGTDNFTSANFIEKMNLATGTYAPVMSLPYDSFSAAYLNGVYLIGTTHENGVPVSDPNLHLYASFDGGNSFSDIFNKPLAYTNGDENLYAQFELPNHDVLIQFDGYGTMVGRFSGATQTQPPVNNGLPQLSGSAQQNQTLTTSNGSWTNSPTSFTYKWQDCDSSGAACAAIGGASSSSYGLQASDVNHTIRSVVTASNSAGQALATSAASAVVSTAPVGGNDLPLITDFTPVTDAGCSGCSEAFNGSSNTLIATIAGGADNVDTAYGLKDFGGGVGWSGRTYSRTQVGLAAGQVINSNLAVFQELDTSGNLVYELYVNGNDKTLSLWSPAGGLSSSSLNQSTGVVVPAGSSIQAEVSALKNNSITVRVNNTDSFTLSGLSGSTTSNPRYLRAGIDHYDTSTTSEQVKVNHTIVGITTLNWLGSRTTTGGNPPPVQPPVNSGLPQLSGTAQQGQSLTTTNGSWTNSPTSFTYKWQDCDTSGNNCSMITGANASSYALQASDVNHTLRSVVTATNSGGSASATSAASAVVAPLPPPPPPSGNDLPLITNFSSVVDGGCSGCSTNWNSGTNTLTATIAGGADNVDTAYGLKDFGAAAGWSGRTYSRTQVGFPSTQALNANLAVFQEYDVNGSLIYELYISSSDKTLRLWSPAGGLDGASINQSTGIGVPTGSTIRAEVSALANNSVTVRVNDVDKIVLTGLKGAVTANPRYLRAGIDHYDGSVSQTVKVAHTNVGITTVNWLGIRIN